VHKRLYCCTHAIEYAVAGLAKGKKAVSVVAAHPLNMSESLGGEVKSLLKSQNLTSEKKTVVLSKAIEQFDTAKQNKNNKVALKIWKVT
jgi:hypothetical protein